MDTYRRWLPRANANLMMMWKAGVLAHVSGMWIAIGTIIAVGLGIMLAVSSGKPEITRE